VGLPRWLSDKESTRQAGDVGSVPEHRRFPGEGNGYQLRYSCLGNAMDRGAWWATVRGVPKRVGHDFAIKTTGHGARVVGEGGTIEWGRHGFLTVLGTTPRGGEGAWVMDGPLRCPATDLCPFLQLKSLCNPLPLDRGQVLRLASPQQNNS